MRVSSISHKFIVENGKRFEGKYYLNDNSFLSMKIECLQGDTCSLSSIADVFNPPVFKRQFCKETERAVKYFQSSDVPVSSEFSSVFVFKEQAESLNLLVKKGDILVTGFGTIGNTRLVNSYQDETCYANNVCRIRANKTIDKNYIYAFMSSKFGRAQLNKNASGSVVRYIEAPGIKKTIIPILPDTKYKRICELIDSSIKHREAATTELEEAKRYLLDSFGLKYKHEEGLNCKPISSKKIVASFKTRFDPPFHINCGVETMNTVRDYVLLQDCDVKMWYPGIFKRAYVKDGYPYIKGSSLFDRNPFISCEQLSRSRTPGLDELWLKEGMLLVSCAGICGQVKIITKEYEDKHAIGSPDIIRLISNDSLFTTEYLYVYLQLPYIYDYLQSLKYGSVIERFDIYNLEKLPIVKPSSEVSEFVTEKVKLHMMHLYKSFIEEEEAVTIIEKSFE